jgi:hypothetical protein
VANASNPESALGLGLRWWSVAFVLVVAYFVNLARIHRGPVTPYGEGGDQDEERAAVATVAPPTSDAPTGTAASR